MASRLFAGAIACAAVVGFASAGFAASGAFDNLCAMALAEGEKLPTDCSVNGVYEGQTYCFGDAAAKELFMVDPAAHLKDAAANFTKIGGE